MNPSVRLNILSFSFFYNTIPLIEGSGNFGTVSGDPAGADRYIKARLSEYARACLFL